MASLNFSPGDYVKLRLAKKEVEGRVLENADSSILLLKLSSGYNVGIPKENVLAGRVLKKFREESNFSLPSAKKGLKNIGLVVTGGTIASKLDPKTGAVGPLTHIGEFAKFYPGLFDIVNVKEIKAPFIIDSSSMNSEHWKIIAEEVGKMLDDKEIEGIIVTHGTDTLHYTSAALSFFLGKLNKPVVLTYAQRSVDRASSDAEMNLKCAAHFALSDCAEVSVVGHASMNDDFCYAMRGTKVRKMHASRRDAFKTVNDVPIAKIFPDGKIEFMGEYNVRHGRKSESDFSFSDKVALLKFYPGQDPSILDYYALKYRGLVIEAGGLGQLPSSDSPNSWIPKLKKCIREGMVVCVCSQTIFGAVNPYVYSNARELLDAGAIFLEDMNSETAFVKLGWVLGHHGWKTHAREKMLENFVGEFNGKREIGFM